MHDTSDVTASPILCPANSWSKFPPPHIFFFKKARNRQNRCELTREDMSAHKVSVLDALAEYTSIPVTQTYFVLAGVCAAVAVVSSLCYFVVFCARSRRSIHL